MSDKPILDACCGSRMFWYDKNHPAAVFMDNRKLEPEILSNNRRLEVNPDVVADFKAIPFPDNTFRLVVFDPPHLDHYSGDNSWIVKTYGKLPRDWQSEIKAGFDECMRVLEDKGVLVFKWSECDITVNKIIQVIGADPLIGHKSGKAMNTHWMLFMKGV
jgi:ubiquinone/menaquinone biosynthesis C-methylase UbiE